MVKKKTKLWCPVTEVHGIKATVFGKTYQVSIPGVDKILTVAENCINEQGKQAFSTGSKLPTSAKVRVNRAFWNFFKIWQEQQAELDAAAEKSGTPRKKKKQKCPVKEIKVRSGWCCRAQSYIIKVNGILDADKASYPQLIDEMKSTLKPPEDIAKLLTTTQFLCNKFTRHHLDPAQPILHPTPGKPGYISWCVHNNV